MASSRRAGVLRRLPRRVRPDARKPVGRPCRRPGALPPSVAATTATRAAPTSRCGRSSPTPRGHGSAGDRARPQPPERRSTPERVRLPRHPPPRRRRRSARLHDPRPSGLRRRRVHAACGGWACSRARQRCRRLIVAGRRAAARGRPGTRRNRRRRRRAASNSTGCSPSAANSHTAAPAACRGA